ALGAGGVAFAALALAYTLIYVAITVVTAFKASGWVKMALEGGDLAGDFLMKQVTTAAEGVLLATSIGAGVATMGVGLAAGGAVAGTAGATGAVGTASTAGGAGASTAGAGTGLAGAGAGASAA